jgi:DNA-binding transcriptional regulator/RsmH inhibitor MraZ
MVIPQVYRNALGNDFVIAPSLDFECVALYPRPIWSEEINKLLLKSRKSTSDAGWALEQFSTLSYENCDVDSQGRVLIPSRIKKQYLGEAKEVVVMGKMTHVLIKSQEKAAEHDRQFMENKADILKRLDMIEV